MNSKVRFVFKLIFIFAIMTCTQSVWAGTLVSLKPGVTYKKYDITGDQKADRIIYYKNGVLKINGKKQGLNLESISRAYYYRYNTQNRFILLDIPSNIGNTIKGYRYVSGKLKNASEQIGAFNSVKVVKLKNNEIIFETGPAASSETFSFKKTPQNIFRFHERYYVNTKTHKIARKSDYGNIIKKQSYYYAGKDTVRLSTRSKQINKQGPLLSYGDKVTLNRVYFKYSGIDYSKGKKIYEISVNGKKGWFVDDANLLFLNKKPPSIYFSIPEQISVMVNEQTKIQVDTTKDVSDINWTSSDDYIVTVSNQGVVTGKKEGTATITASIDDITAKCEIKVIKTKIEDKSSSYKTFDKSILDVLLDNPVTASYQEWVKDPCYSKRIIAQGDIDESDLKSLGAKNIVFGPERVIFLQFNSVEQTRTALKELEKTQRIEFAEADFIMKCDDAKHETRYSSYFDTWPFEMLQAEAFAENVKMIVGERPITVAVVDSGVSKHPDLMTRLLPGYDFVDNDSDPTDVYNHGTPVAGIIQKCTEKLNVFILPVRIGGADGYSSNILSSIGIHYAIDHGAKIINYSYGGPLHTYIDIAVKRAISEGVTFITSAGNLKQDANNYCPAHIPEVITVSGTDKNLKLYRDTNYGNCIDICAPGVDVVSYSNDGKYCLNTGTSFSAPFVSAYAAMYKLMNPSYTPEQIQGSLKLHAKDLGEKGWDKFYGYGLLQPYFEKVTSYISIPKEIIIRVGERHQIHPDTKNTSTKDITWKTENASVATVSSEGMVIGKSLGETTVSASKDDVTVKCKVKVVSKVVSVSSGNSHTAILKEDGTLWITGDDNVSSGNGGSDIPIHIMNNVKYVTTGLSSTAAIKNDSTLWTWGDNYYGLLGDGTKVDRLSPVYIMSNVRSVSMGGTHTGIIKTDNSLWMCGTNSSGQLGDGTQIDRLKPVKIMDNVKSVNCGLRFTFVIKNDNSLWAFGSNDYGVFGNGTNTSQSKPIKIMDNVLSCSAGYENAVIVKTDGSMWMCGSFFGSNREYLPRLWATEVKKACVCRWNDSLDDVIILKNDGTVWTRGHSNWSGQLGDGTTIEHDTWKQILTDMSDIDSGAFHCCAIGKDGTLYAWGYNYYGQLGIGNKTDQLSPVPVC